LAGTEQLSTPRCFLTTLRIVDGENTPSSVRRALIIGVTGQDGRYLAEFLHDRGYHIFGLVTGQANPLAELMREEFPFVEMVGGDLQDFSSLIAAVDYCQPDEVYNLGAISFVPLSFKQPELTANVTGLGVLRLLEAIRLVGGQDNRIRFYQASSSEMFGKVRESPQNENTPFYPRSPYGAAKVFGHQITVNYREAYGLFACSGILFNHESPRRGHEFVTRKVSSAVARIKLGLQDDLPLGNLAARRDWGFAGDYANAMWLMLQQDEPDDYVIATGETRSVEELVQIAFKVAGIDDWERYVRVEERFFRPADVDSLVGDAAKARRLLGWEPTVTFEGLVTMMVENDLRTEARNIERRRREEPVSATSPDGLS
jgi:GDPmannose 4,6-dehydratase